MIEALIDDAAAMAVALSMPREQLRGGSSAAPVSWRSSSSRDSSSSSAAPSVSAGSVVAALVTPSATAERAGASQQQLCERLELCCLCDFRVWVRASCDVQLAHLRTLQRRVRSARRRQQSIASAPSTSPPARGGSSEGSYTAGVLTVRHVIDALRTLYTGRAARLAPSELHAVRLEVAALAGQMLPSVIDVMLVLARLAELREPAARVPFVHVLVAWLQAKAGGEGGSADEGYEPADDVASANDASSGGGMSNGVKDAAERQRGYTAHTPSRQRGVAGRLSRSHAGSCGERELQADGVTSPTHHHQQQQRTTGASQVGVTQCTLEAIAERGGAPALLVQLAPPQAELREATLRLLALYANCVPTSSVEIENHVAGMVASWVVAEQGVCMSDGVCAALLRLSASATDQTRLRACTILPALLRALPAASPACQFMLLSALLPYLDGPHGGSSAEALLSDAMCIKQLLETARSIGSAVPSRRRTSTTSSGSAEGADGASAAASLSVCVNFGEVHVSLLLCSAPAASKAERSASAHPTAASHPSEERSASAVSQLSLHVLARLLRHSLELPDGWRFLPLVHAILDDSHPPAVTSHVLLVLCCRALASLERPLLSGDLPPIGTTRSAAGGGAAAGVHHRTSTLAHGALAAASTSPSHADAAPTPIPSAEGGVPFWPNLAHFLHCLDQLLLRSHAVWLAGGAVGHGEAGLGFGALGPSGLAVGDELLSAGAAAHLVGALVFLAQNLSAPLRCAPDAAPLRSPLMCLCSDTTTFRMVVQWLIAAIRIGWRDGARLLDASPLALPVQLLLRLTAPLSLPHATATLVLASLLALGDQRPTIAAPLLARLLSTHGPSGDRWEELLPGAGICRGSPGASPSPSSPAPFPSPPPLALALPSHTTMQPNVLTPERTLRPRAPPPASSPADGTSSAVSDSLSVSRLRRYAQSEAVREAHSEVNEAQSAAARQWAASLRPVVDAMLERLRELSIEEELSLRGGPTPLTPLAQRTPPLPPTPAFAPSSLSMSSAGRGSGAAAAARAAAREPLSLEARLYECERRAERCWRKMLRSLEHESALGLAPLLVIDAVPAAGSTSASSGGSSLAGSVGRGSGSGASLVQQITQEELREASKEYEGGVLPVRWRLDRWEGPQLPPSMAGVAGNGRMRLKLRRDFAPSRHRLAAHDLKSEPKEAPPPPQLPQPPIDACVEAEAESDEEQEEPPSTSYGGAGSGSGGGGSGSGGGGGGGGGGYGSADTDDAGVTTVEVDLRCTPLDDENAEDCIDGAALSAAARLALADGETLVLTTRCYLVRGLAKQAGTLFVSHEWIRFEPEGGMAGGGDSTDGLDENEPPPIAWVRDGEAEVAEVPRPRAWRVGDLREVLPRRHLLRRVALELFFAGGAAHFLCFDERETRRRVHQRIVALKPPALRAASFNVHFGRDLLEARHQQLLDDWQSWRISNFDYLMRLNTLAGRSFNDLTQYPVFPWILKDYTSATLDLDDWEKTFRDLSKPVGAQDAAQAAKFAERYDSYEDAGMGAKPFHYGSHYSSAGIVLHYLMRLEPFVQEHIQLQGGRFDVADRLFDSVEETWRTCLTNMSDVKELIPEFFTNAEFLRNSNDLPLGTMQNGHTLGDVTLPAWASSPEDFVRQHRAALESDYVSEHLHLWINLIFGYQQRGSAAVDAINVFYYLT